MSWRIRRDHHVRFQHPGETRTIPLAIYTAIQTPGGEAAAARLAALSIMLALVGLILADWVARKTKVLVGQ